MTRIEHMFATVWRHKPENAPLRAGFSLSESELPNRRIELQKQTFPPRLSNRNPKDTRFKPGRILHRPAIAPCAGRSPIIAPPRTLEDIRFIGLDIHKEPISIAVAESGRSWAVEIAKDPKLPRLEGV